MTDPSKINIDRPRYDQSTYAGRVMHFFKMVSPLNCLATDKQLDEAKRVVEEFRKTKKFPAGYDENKLWQTKYLYDSAFHPDTGEKIILIGRMSAQAPMNTLITGGMITWYKTTPATVFWQWLNQTFNAIVNYSNRSGDKPIPAPQLMASYCGACGGALGTALYLNSKVKNMNPIFAKLVPFAAVCIANCINIPMMRSNELLYGTPVFSPDGQRIGESKIAAAIGIGLVAFSRVVMATPGMVLPPLATTYGTKRGWFRRRPWLVVPFQIGLVGLCLTFATPLACAIFTQKMTLPASILETEIAEKAKDKKIKTVVFNKVFTPMMTNYGIKQGWFNRNPKLITPFQVGLVSLCVVFATPLCCAIFEQRMSLPVSILEPEIKAVADKKKVSTINFNKGL